MKESAEAGLRVGADVSAANGGHTETCGSSDSEDLLHLSGNSIQSQWSFWAGPMRALDLLRVG